MIENLLAAAAGRRGGDSGSFTTVEIVEGNIGQAGTPITFADTPEENDVIYVIMISDKARAAPAGWTQELLVVGSDLKIAFSRVCGASETNSYEFGGSNASIFSAATVIRGSHSASFGTTVELSPTSPDGPEPTVDAGDTALFCYFAYSGGSAITSITGVDEYSMSGLRAGGGSENLTTFAPLITHSGGAPSAWESIHARIEPA